MYNLKRAIRRYAAGCAGLLCLVLVVASTSRCTGDSLTGAADPSPENPVLENPAPQDPAPQNPAPENPAPEDLTGTPSEVGSVTLTPESLTVAVGETAQLTVIVRDRTGAVIANPQVVFLQNDLPVGTVNSIGLVTGLPPGDDCGFGTVIARSGGVNSNTVVVVIRNFSQSEAGGCWAY